MSGGRGITAIQRFMATIAPMRPPGGGFLMRQVALGW